ncbi:MmyB family transcriptional regulator [Amycolatopsis pithecellobii]|uniref:MmyB family transcriptional regulator n=1 Tax=Amycolatopsis pithecellobii TaxID=664692 RepID=UPI001FE26CFF|nr:hypothetical protein [Amycolatopsis pithecellobii]
MKRHVVPQRGTLRLDHPAGHQLQLHRETLELPADAQQIVVFHPANEQTTQAVDQLRRAELRTRRLVHSPGEGGSHSTCITKVSQTSRTPANLFESAPSYTEENKSVDNTRDRVNTCFHNKRDEDK